MKKNAKQRKKKQELIQQSRQKDEYDRHIKYLFDTEAMLAQRKLKIEDAVAAFADNEMMRKMLQENGNREPAVKEKMQLTTRSEGGFDSGQEDKAQTTPNNPC